MRARAGPVARFRLAALTRLSMVASIIAMAASASMSDRAVEYCSEKKETPCIMSTTRMMR